MGYQGKYTMEMLKELSLKCNNKSDFASKYSGAHKAAKKLNYLEELFEHVVKYDIEVGRKFNRLTILREVEPEIKHTKDGKEFRSTMVICECECGNITKPTKLTNVKNSATKSCGCIGKEKISELGKTKRKFDVQIGDRFGTLVVTSFKEQRYNVECLCDCGATKTSTFSRLHSGNGGCSVCSRKPMKVKEAKGKYGRLTILREVERLNPKLRRVFVECDCGKQFESGLSSVKSGNTKSCGCYKLERTLESRIFHGDSLRVGKDRVPEYTAWKAMKQRCYYKKGQFYYLYGGRGIKVCGRWLEPNGQGYTNFINDMGRKPSSRHSLDRKDPDKDYGPDNCKWSTDKEQRKNQRTFVDYGGRNPKAIYRNLYQKHHNVRVKRGNYIHHIDWNRENNVVDNLIEVTKEEHKWLHHSERLHFRELKYVELKDILHNRNPNREIGIEKESVASNEPPILNKEYTWLTITELIGPLNRYKTYTNVKTICRCGSVNTFPFSQIKRGYRVSCGCYHGKVHNHWTENEVNILKEHYGKMRRGLLSKFYLPNREPRTISDKIRQLKKKGIL